MDIRVNKTEPFAQSEDQEDELLSIVGIKGFVFGTLFLLFPTLMMSLGTQSLL